MSAARSIAIVDLGLGNLRSVARAFERAGASPSLVREPAEVRAAEALVVPGQGAFRDCARALEGGLGAALVEAIDRGVPYFGICLGMQVLFDESAEAPGARGLGVLGGRVVRFAPDLADAETGAPLKVPHVGWNDVRATHPLLPEREWFYFVHSYYCEPADPGLVVATAEHGVSFCAAVARGTLFACQFHPEKSHDAGRRLIDGFLAAS